MLLQLDPNLLTSILTSDSPAGEQCLPIFSTIALKQKRRMLFAPMDFQHFSIDARIDSGALVNCMPESEYRKLKNMSPTKILQESNPPPSKLQVANGDMETPIKTIQIQFEIGDWTFKETLIVASKITGSILGLTFLNWNSAILHASQGLLHFPHLTYAINPVSDEQPMKPHEVTILNQTTLALDQCSTVEALVNISSIADTTCVIHPISAYTEDKPIIIASSLSTVHEMKVPIRKTKTSPTPFTIKKNTVVAEFHITTPKEAKNIKPLSTAALKVLTEDDSEQAIEYVNELLKTTEKLETTQQFWFPTPDNPDNPSTHTPVQRRSLRETEELEESKTWTPQTAHKKTEISWEVQVGRLTAWRTGSERHRRHPCRIPRHYRPTSPRHWSQPRLQDETDAKKWPARIHANPTLPSKPQGRSHKWTCPNALLRHHNHTAVQQVC